MTNALVTLDNREVVNINARIAHACQNRVEFETKEKLKRAKQLEKFFDLTLDGARVVSCEASEAFTDALESYGLADCDFICDKRKSNQMFNIYAIEKIAKLVRASITGLASMSEYCEVTLRNLKFNRMLIDSRKLTISQSFLCQSFDRIARSDVQSTRVKYYKTKACGESTSATQAGSTMRALEAIKVIEIERKQIVRVNYDHPIFDTL